MPNARVGALPQPSKPKEQQQQEMSGRGRGSRNKGITMEDLKQQTAMRLAKEQHHQRNGFSGGSTAAGNQNDGATQQQDPTNVLNNSHLAHFNHYNAVHQQGLLHHGYEMRDRVYSADGSCTSSLTNDNGGESSSTGLPVSAPSSSAAAQAGSAAAGLSPMGHASSTRINHPLLIATGDNEKHHNKNVGRGNVKSTYVRGSPSYSQRQPSSQQMQSGQSNRPKSLKKKQQRQKMNPDVDLYSPAGQQQYQGYAPTDMNNPSSMNYSAPAFQPDRQQRNKKGAHRHGTTPHGHFYPQSGMAHHGYHEIQFGGKQSKLPHGLTVQELKEMTKARLAAEAAEKNESQAANGEDQFVVVHQDQAQPDVSSNHSVVTQASSSSDCDSYRRSENRHGQNHYPYIHNRQNSMESTASAPPAPPSGVRTHYQPSGSMCKSQSHQGLNDFSHSGTQPQRQMQMSPEHSNVQMYNQHAAPQRGPPPGLSSVQQGQLVSHHTNLSAQNQHKVTHQRQQEWRQQIDALETSSVNSMNSGLGSEYLGSESAFVSLQNTSSVSMNDDNGNMAFGRSISYPAGGNISNALEHPPHESTPMSATATPSSLFDHCSGGPNRRRTSTMSPPLSNLHEDRPLTATSLCADDYLSIPLFDSTPNSKSHTRVHHVEFSPSPTPPSREVSPAFSRYGGSNSNLGSGSVNDMLHRPNSASTVPTVTPSIDNADDHEDLPPLSFGLSDRATSAGVASMSEELPNSVAESVLGTPLIMEGRKVASTDNTTFQHSDIKRSDENDISAVFRNSPAYGGSESGVLAFHVPGREVSLSSTSSFFSDTNILGQSADFGASRSRTHSWAGSTNAMTPIGASSIPGPPSNLADDLNKLLDFSETNESAALSTPWEVELDDDPKRAPSLVSRIDPELKVDPGILPSSLSPSYAMRGDTLPHCDNQCVPPAPPVPDTTLNRKAPNTIPDAETRNKQKGSNPHPTHNKRGNTTKRKNRRGRRKPKGDPLTGANP